MGMAPAYGSSAGAMTLSDEHHIIIQQLFSNFRHFLPVFFASTV
jgi:hypothetical protein